MRTRIRSAMATVRRGLVRRATPGGPGVVGMVERFQRGRLFGWVSVPAGSPAVKVDLVLDDFVVGSTYATRGGAMSRVGRAGASKGGGRKSAPQQLVGPEGDRRDGFGEVQVFSIRLRGIWPYVRRTTRITVQVDGQPLPIHGHGMYLRPPQRGAHSLADLRARFAEGYLLDQKGAVTIERGLDTEWQHTVMSLHGRVRQLLREQFGYDIFLVYGTLLGAVREGGPIRHDGDFDTAYLSRHTEPRAVAEEFEQIGLALVRAGFRVECLLQTLHIFDADLPEHRIDLFHSYFDADGQISFSWGAAGSSPFTRHDWQGLRPTTFLGEDALVPVAAEELVAYLYGEDWRQPKPGFSWDVDRTSWTREAHLSQEQRTRVYWADFYNRHQFDTGSTFSRFVADRPGTPGALVDLGCGDGRDACALGATGRTVLGVDASEEGVAHASGRARELGLDQVSFAACDVADREALRGLLEKFRSDVEGPVGFYLRFFLHAIHPHAQDALMATIDAVARPGDQLLAEFRTLGDQDVAKTHGRHYRRFIDAPAFRDELESRHGFTVDHFVEDRGLSPYGEEDPVLCRIVATRAG